MNTLATDKKFLESLQKLPPKFVHYIQEVLQRQELKQAGNLNSPKANQVSLVKLLSQYSITKVNQQQKIYPALVSSWMQKAVKASYQVYNHILDIFAFSSAFTFPQIAFEQRRVRILGSYSPGIHTVTYSLFALLSEKEKFINEIIPHEFAHVVLFHAYQLKLISRKEAMGHGHAFKVVAMILGSSGNSTYCTLNAKQIEEMLHNASHEEYKALTNLAPKRRTEYLYSCACPERIHSLKATRHKRMQSKQTNYICTTCRSSLIFTGNSRQPNLFVDKK
ncbi:hypothetical protein CKF54_06040 [Psittacicella hinzii]|uniref:SprT-like domain-containing protein n=1 Tax=Psittacicella hinzii TaxID=2028575 RepID=A0A3A1Y3E0_9GAMM|nr:SprT-like domain-containing protein [Psittacicella hinzii]RIY31819.1 hypothetical protein CKF54_06040 [Psittacicella hinzii]